MKLLSYIKKDQETTTFGENGVEIRKLHRYKNTIF